MKYFLLISFTIALTLVACNENHEKTIKVPSGNVSKSSWKWHDSLDALNAAADYHKLLFEDSSLRILEVVVPPGELDPIHTHKGNSIVWVTHTSPIIYNTYDLNSQNNYRLTKSDTLFIKSEELNKGMREKPEPPHSVENIGKDTFRLYRIEYKETNNSNE